MSAAILPICLSLMAMAFYRRHPDLRIALIQSAVTLGVILAAITESLSIFHALRYTPVLMAWIAASIAAAVAIFFVRPIEAERRLAAQRWPLLDRALWLVLAAIIAVVGFAAIVGAPANWDSMTYHLARVEHWRQAASVAHYPTSIPRQLYMSPWAEFAILHLRLLSGADRFAAMPQWVGFIGSCIGVSLIAQQLGLDRRGQLVAALIAATIPNGLLQAGSTQNNYVAAGWLMAFVYFTLSWLRTPRPFTALSAGAALGLALLTKSTTYFFATPFLIVLLVHALRNDQPRRILQLGVIAFMVIALNALHLHRNFAAFQSISMPRADLALMRNDTMSPALLASNVIRDLAEHLAGSNRWNDRLISFEASVHRRIGLSLNDPRITSYPDSYHLDPISRHEDISGNPVHMVLVAITAIALLIKRKLPLARAALPILLAAIVGWLLFAAGIKWQGCEPRLELPVFVLAAAPIAAAARLFRPPVTWVLLTILIACAMPMMLANRLRPLIGRFSILHTTREDEYFTSSAGLEKPYQAVADQLAQHRIAAIDLVCSGDGWEYPLWPLMADRGVGDFNIRFLYVNNSSAACWQPFTDPPRPLLLLDAEQRSTLRTLRPGWAEQDIGRLTLFLPPTPAR